MQESVSSPLASSEATNLSNNGNYENSPINSSITEAQLSDEERRLKEEEESERLAWELMQEESMNAYQMQVDYIKANSANMTNEDLEALQSILGQEPQMNTNNQHDPNDSNVEEEDEEEGDVDLDALNYDQLLALGEHIGDVYTDKWKLRSEGVIRDLTRITYAAIAKVSTLLYGL